MAQQLSLVAPAAAPTGAVVVNRRCSVHAEGEQRVVVVVGLPVHHYSVQDAVAEAYAMVLLVDGGHATQVEVARAFGCSERTLRRHQERYSRGGMAALSSPHRTLAIEALCLPLNDTATCFPGTGLRLQFELAPQPPSSMAFPGPRPSTDAPAPDKPDSSAQG